MAPSPPHLFEVWADQACTVRPVVGNEYTELYLQVNADVYEQCPTPDYCNDNYGVNYLACPDGQREGDDIQIIIFVDFVSASLGTYQPGVDLTLHKGTYKCSVELPILITENEKLSSGPIVPYPLHTFEVWADQACTQRPVVGNEYTELFLQVNADVAEQCPSPVYCDDSYGVNYRTCSDEYVNADPIAIELFDDFVSDRLGTYQPGVDVTLHKGIYKCTASQPKELKNYQHLSTGPIVG